MLMSGVPTLCLCGFTTLLYLGRFFSFLILYTVSGTPWMGDQPVARPLPTHRTTQNKRTHTSMPLVRFEPTTLAIERSIFQTFCHMTVLCWCLCVPTQRFIISVWLYFSCRFLTFCYLAAFNCWLLLCPATLSHDWQMGSVPLLTSLTDSRNIATCLFFGCCFLIAYRGIADFEVSLIHLLLYNFLSSSLMHSVVSFWLLCG
jgi:hypothetical protein